MSERPNSRYLKVSTVSKEAWDAYAAMNIVTSTTISFDLRATKLFYGSDDWSLVDCLE